jgi:hypothetical protein
MLIRFHIDRQGNVYGDPTNDRQRAQLVARIPKEVGNDSLIFIQSPDSLYEALDRVMARHCIRKLDEGYTVTCRVSDDVVDALVGAE